MEIPKSTGLLRFPSEFVEVTCTINGKTVKDYYGTAFPPAIHSNQTAAKARFWETQAGRPPSVLVIGIDSVSSLHFKRSLPQTLGLLGKSGFVDLKGYTRLGENTFPNVMAMLGGMVPPTPPHHFYDCMKRGWGKLDDCPLIWREFSKLGYITAFLEDEPSIAAFNYDKTGFVQQPTDYYLRTLSIGYRGKVSKSRNIFWRYADCVSGLPMFKMMAKYTKEFVDVMGGKNPYFLFSWYTSAVHDDFNGLKVCFKRFTRQVPGDQLLE